MRLTYYTLDVFTDTPFGGNQLAVIVDADDVPDKTMQAIARELNLSETVFVQSASKPAHTARLRIFTPTKELPFAGHPSVGAAALIAELRALSGNGEHDALVVLEQAIGTVRVGVRMRPDLPPFAEFDAPKLPAEAGELPPVDTLSAGLGLIPSEIGFENHRPTCFAAGNAFCLRSGGVFGSHRTRAGFSGALGGGVSGPGRFRGLSLYAPLPAVIVIVPCALVCARCWDT